MLNKTQNLDRGLNLQLRLYLEALKELQHNVENHTLGRLELKRLENNKNVPTQRVNSKQSVSLQWLRLYQLDVLSILL